METISGKVGLIHASEAGPGIFGDDCAISGDAASHDGHLSGLGSSYCSLLLLLLQPLLVELLLPLKPLISPPSGYDFAACSPFLTCLPDRNVYFTLT